MKKLLLTLSSVFIIAGAAGSVVSCGVKPEKNVIFALIGGSSMSDTDLEKLNAYKEMADEFNEQNRDKEGFVPVNVVWRESSYLNNAVLTGDNLPDLYISYVDAASTYLESTVADQVRDMEKSMGDQGFEKFKDDLITPAFIDEGKYKDTQVVLPFGKSFDISVINVNLLFQFMDLFDDQNVKNKLSDLQNTYAKYNNERSSVLENKTEMSGTKVFREGLKLVPDGQIFKEKDNVISIDKSTYNSLVELFSKVENSVEGIKSIFALTKNVLALTKAMNQIIQKNGLDVTVKIEDNKYVKPNEKYNFAFGIDSLDNKYYMDYASTDKGHEIIDVKNDSDFWYNTNYENKIAEINLESNNQSFKETSEYLQGMKDIAVDNIKDSKPGLSYSEQWNGVFSTSRYEQNSQSKTYITQDFTKGTMFMGSASSANDFYFTSSWEKEVDVYNDNQTSNAKPSREVAKYSPVTRADILTTSKTNGSNPEKSVFMSQGRGIAGFKSNGSNAAQKEESVKGFLNYIMQPIPTARFALRTSYMPATKSGMLIYENYLNGNFNNENNTHTNEEALAEAIVDIKKIYDKEDINLAVAKELIPMYFKQIKNNKGTPEWKAGISPVNTGFINDYLNPKISTNDTENKRKNISLVSSKANPVTDIVRSGLKNAISGTNGVMDLLNKQDMKFFDLLNKPQNSKDTAYLSYWLGRNQGDFYKEIHITYPSKKAQ
ncbi:hypothetical protein CG001_00090 [Mesoplasma coleopterae]|uniref:hypothetical protein n=1 Tax=Mesoplasma coleopterae TaxID=324078 RepID=UPI000D031529|nr:hypothetical protein [Mesoplasma coleopterae]AVN62061.1 hypothetical protein CG001_00090 [Mesoplasma coleopterae]